MNARAFHRSLLASLLVLAATTAQAQIPKLELALPAAKAANLKQGLARGPSAAVRVRAPARMTQAEYVAMRPALASLLKRVVATLPAQLIPSTNLSTVGHTLNVAVGQRMVGGGFSSFNSLVIASDVALFDHPVASYCAMSQTNSEAYYIAPIQGPGTYMITVYVDPITTKANMTAFSADSTGNYETSPALVITPQNGKMFVVKEVTSANAREVGVLLTMNGNAQVYMLSCDFVRIY